MPPPPNKRQRQPPQEYSHHSSSSHHQRGGGGAHHQQQQHGSRGDSRGQQRVVSRGGGQQHSGSSGGGEGQVSIRRREHPVEATPVHKIELPPAPPPSVADFYCAEDELASKLTNPAIVVEAAELIGTLRTLLMSPNNANDANQANRDTLLVKAIRLRRLNRLSNFRNRQLRNTVAVARERAEDAYLQLANVKSEIGHLRRAIDACLEAQSDDADIDLVPVEEFFERAPSEIKRDEPTLLGDEHQMHLARLNYELWERKNMVSTLQELEGRRGVLLSDIRGKEQRLGQIPPRIDALKEAAQPLLDLLGMGKKLGRAEFDIRAKLEHLPAQLKPIHIQLEVYNKIVDGDEPVEIGCEGIVDDVGKFTASLMTEEEELDEHMDDADDEREESPEAEENGPAVPPTSATDDDEGPTTQSASNPKPAKASSERSRRAHHSLSASIAEKLERKRLALLSVHPISLSISVGVAISGGGPKGPKATLRFTYAPQLQCVFVKCRLEDGAKLLKKAKDSGARDALLDEQTLLDELFDGDDGSECPSDVGQSLAEMFGVDLTEHYPAMGKPYQWAQRLAGLISPSSTTAEQPTPMQHFEWTVECVQRVRERLHSRLSLARWAKAMAKPAVTGKPLARIESFVAGVSTDELREFVAASPNPLHAAMLAEWDEGGLEFIFSAELVRGAFRLRAMIRVPVNYPREQSVVMLAMASDAHKGGMELTKGVWELERYVNCDVALSMEGRTGESSARYGLVSAQLDALLTQLDAVLEIGAKRVGSADFEVTRLYATTSVGARQQGYPLNTMTG